jgi:YHS domain-containing protein
MRMYFYHMVIAVALVFPAITAHAKPPIYTALFSKKAVGGYDTVSYFSGGKPEKGLEEFQTKWKEADWYFKSQENLDTFKASPDKYAPQYGGYCAWAVAAKKDLVKGDPMVYNIHNGKLYLNYDESVRQAWTDKKDDFILQADTLYPTLLIE